MNDPRPPPNDAEPNDAEQVPVAVDIGTNLDIDLGPLIGGALPYSFQDLRRAMNDDTTVTNLDINFPHSQYNNRTRHHDNQVFAQFLREYIMGRNHLRMLSLTSFGGRHRWESLRRRILMAAATSETIQHLDLLWEEAMPVQDLVDFFRQANRNVKVLELTSLDFVSNEAGALDLVQAGTAAEQFSRSSLDKLSVDNIHFDCQKTALEFASLASTLHIKDLELGHMTCRADWDEERKEARNNMISRVLNGSSVKRLKLFHDSCTPDIFCTALAARKSTLEQLHVNVGVFLEDFREIFMQVFPELSKLKSLHLTLNPHYGLNPEMKKQLFQAIDACVTLTEIQVNDGVAYDDYYEDELEEEEEGVTFSPQELQLLRGGRTERNATLQRFVKSPPQLSQKELLVLMLQLQNCPTGRFQLARKLPIAYFRGKQS